MISIDGLVANLSLFLVNTGYLLLPACISKIWLQMFNTISMCMHLAFVLMHYCTPIARTGGQMQKTALLNKKGLKFYYKAHNFVQKNPISRNFWLQACIVQYTYMHDYGFLYVLTWA